MKTGKRSGENLTEALGGEGWVTLRSFIAAILEKVFPVIAQH